MLSAFSTSSTRASAGNGDYFSNDSLPASPKVLSPIPRRLTNDSPSSSSLYRQPPSPILHSPALSISTAFPPLNPSPGPSPNRTVPRSPYLSSRELSSPYSASSPVPRRPSLPAVGGGETRNSWSSYSAIEDILTSGDIVGEGLDLQGESVRPVLISDRASQQGTAKEFEVVRKLGSGSYAVVYLVREVLSRGAPFSDDGHCAGRLELDDAASRKSTEYGREYAMKCLSKANLDEEALEAQMAEVNIHQSLPTHPNIVTLHGTFETSAFLLLLLEFVPGEDLFYFLEQARDHYDSDPASGASAAFEDAILSNRTPPTPSILSSLGPAQLLSRTRLKLIASMFNQMCEAVATCHDVQVFHRDIKPENFIVTDGHRFLSDGTRERKVIVKLSDFGLSTTDLESSDMDCGSAPYMSYECRNNIAPTYKPRAADVWSLGVVLINMLYHFNPWTDTADGACESFELFRGQPINFFLQRFTGMTQPVAEFLASRVFCIIGDSDDDSMRVSAREFGNWVKDLPVLMCPVGAHKRLISTSSIQGHPISSSIPGSRPASRQASTASAARTPAMHTRSLSRGPPQVDHAFDMDAPELSTIMDQEPEMEEEDAVIHEQPELEQQLDQDEHEHADDCASRCQSTTRRRKRGARKGKGVQGAQPAVLEIPRTHQEKSVDADVGTTLAMASQSLARELSKQSKLPPPTIPAFAATVSPTFMPSLGLMNVAPVIAIEPIVAAPVVTESRPPITKKSSIWKLGFGSKSSSERPSPSISIPSPTDTTPGAGRSESVSSSGSKSISATASNVSSLLMGLNASVPPPTEPTPVPKPPSPVSMFAVDDGFGRGRGPQKPVASSSTGIAPRPNAPPAFTAKARATSPNSMRSGNWQTASSASSTYSNNWRSSMSSAATSTSAFTRYSNGSRQSVSTVATSVSSNSWRTGNASKPSIASSAGSRAKSPLGPDAPGMPPRNVKIMHGIPSELVSLPRGQAPNPNGDLFSGAPPRKARTRKAKNALGPIDEQPVTPNTRTDAATSTTDLSAPALVSEADADAGGPKKVQKGQINALAKMLSALRR